MPRTKNTIPDAVEAPAQTKGPETLHYPFIPEIRAYDESVQRELSEQIQRVSSFYSLPITGLSATISLNYIDNVWRLSGEVVHTNPHDKEGRD